MKKLEFDFLEGVAHSRISKKSCHFSIHDLPPEDFAAYVDQIFYERRKHKDLRELRDVGDLINTSYNYRRGDFTSSELEVAADYFWNDFNYAYSCSQDCFHAFQRGETLGDEEDTPYYGLVLVRRAIESLTDYDFFSSEVNSQDDSDTSPEHRDLMMHRNILYLSREFPDNYLEVITLVNQMSEAVDVEDYETAAAMRDRIKDLTRFVHPNFPNVLRGKSAA